MLRGVVDEAEIAFASAKSISRVHCSRVWVEVSRTFCRNGSVTIVLVMVTLLPLWLRSWVDESGWFEARKIFTCK